MTEVAKKGSPERLPPVEPEWQQQYDRLWKKMRFRKIWDRVYLSGCPEPEEFEVLRQRFGIDTFINLNEPYERLDEYARRHGLNMRYMFVQDLDDASPATKREFLAYTRQMLDKSHTILAFCKAGFGRATRMGVLFLEDRGIHRGRAYDMALNGCIPKAEEQKTIRKVKT
jgi:protein tyrosine phosphatase (PTP) superfamily phosphohydrolase (DUF442 family)